MLIHRTLLAGLWLAFLSALPALCAPASLLEAVRAGDRRAVEVSLGHGGGVEARDAHGETPLMVAALSADGSILEMLLKAGAAVNATNPAGATALMRAAVFPEKVRLLVAHGADVRARSALGNTALMLAARRPGNSRTVAFLLEHGAEVTVSNQFGSTALMGAVAAEDPESVRLLLDHGADPNARPTMDGNGVIMGGGRTPLMWAAFRGDVRLIQTLVDRGARVNDVIILGSALTQAAWAGNADAARALLDRGAQVDLRDLVANYTPLHWAASSEVDDPRLVELLLARHADVNAEGGQPVDGFLGVTHTPLTLALKRGDTAIAQALRKAGGRDSTGGESKTTARATAGFSGAVDELALGTAIRRAVPPLRRTAVESTSIFRRHASQQTCISCHQQELPLAALSVAASRHLVDESGPARQLVGEVESFAEAFRETDLQTLFHPEPVFGNGYSLLSLALQHVPAGPRTDSQIHQICVVQRADGSWPWNLPRPPVQSGPIGATALAVHGLKSYPIPGRQQELDDRVRRARGWLRRARPESSEERAYQILGLAWAGDSASSLRPLAEALLREQRADGGWGQLAKLPSDAYATGHSLYALLEGARVSADRPDVRRGLEFLLRTQLADGTWHVRRRAFPFQPPMDSGFPHGADGWISSSASSWAVMALASAIDPARGSAIAGRLAGAEVAPVLATTARPAVPSVGDVDFARDVKPILERSCVACHSGERAKGGLQVVTRAAVLRGGKRGEPAIVAGKPESSLLLRCVTDQIEDLEMPPLGKRGHFPALSPEEVGRLSRWIAQGAAWPEDVVIKAPAH